MAIRIKDGNKYRAVKYAESAASFLGPDLMGIDFDNALEYDQYVYALSSLIKCNRDFSEIKSIIQMGIRDFKKCPTQTPEDLIKILNLCEKNIFIDKKKSKYYIVYPTNIRKRLIKKKYFDLMGTRIHVYSYRYLSNAFDMGHLDSIEIDIAKKIFKPDLAYLLIEIDEIDSKRAALKAFRKFELLRSIINFAYDYGVGHFRFSAIRDSEPLSFVQPKNHFLLFDNNRKYLEYWNLDGNFSSRELDIIPENLINGANILLRKLNTVKDCALKNLIKEAFMLYGNVLDYYNIKAVSFLFIWQIFELISLSSTNKGISYDDICTRMVSFFDENSPKRDIIDLIKRKRNNLVHNGKFGDVNDIDINNGKVIAEVAIGFLLFKSDLIKNLDGLKIYFEGIDYYERLNSLQELEHRKKILREVSKSREIK
jgi:hypothetical protein